MDGDAAKASANGRYDVRRCFVCCIFEVVNAQQLEDVTEYVIRRLARPAARQSDIMESVLLEFLNIVQRIRDGSQDLFHVFHSPQHGLRVLKVRRRIGRRP